MYVDSSTQVDTVTSQSLTERTSQDFIKPQAGINGVCPLSPTIVWKRSSMVSVEECAHEGVTY